MGIANDLFTKFRNGFSAAGLIVRATADTDDTAAPTITSGTGAPTGAEVNGSRYVRTDHPNSQWQMDETVWIEQPGTLVPTRFGLRWVAGQHGKPGLNADIQNAFEATRMIADPEFEILGTNAVSSCTSHYAEGGITLTTTTASGDQVIVLPHLDAEQGGWGLTTWGTDKQTIWECRIATAAAITSEIIWAGLKLTNTSVVATDDHQVFFRYEAGVNSGKWQVIYSIGGTDTTVDAGVTVAVSTAYHLKVIIDASRIARCYINGALVATSTALTDATDLIPYIGIQTATTAAKTLYVTGQAISRVQG